MVIRNIFSLFLGAFRRKSDTSNTSSNTSSFNTSEINSENPQYLPPSSEEDDSETEGQITEDNQNLTKIQPKNIWEKKSMINISMLQDMLQNFVTSTPDAQGVALVSPDGLSLASVLPTQMDEERTAAMSASILSLGERIGSELSRGSVERIVVEGDKGYGILVGCGSEAVLLVLASSSAKQGLLFLEIKRITSKITELLG